MKSKSKRHWTFKMKDRWLVNLCRQRCLTTEAVRLHNLNIIHVHHVQWSFEQIASNVHYIHFVACADKAMSIKMKGEGPK